MRPLPAPLRAGVGCSSGHCVCWSPLSFSRTVVSPSDQLSLESPLLQGMACCHSLTLIGGEVRGDPLDCRMFEATKWVCGVLYGLVQLSCPVGGRD